MLMKYADGLDGIAFHHHDSAEPMVTVVVALADVERAEEVSADISGDGGLRRDKNHHSSFGTFVKMRPCHGAGKL